MLLSEKIVICKMYYTAMVSSRADLQRIYQTPIIFNHFNPKYTVLRSFSEESL